MTISGEPGSINKYGNPAAAAGLHILSRGFCLSFSQSQIFRKSSAQNTLHQNSHQKKIKIIINQNQ